MKKLPWNRFTKHLCVFIVLSLLLLAYFWKIEFILALVAVLIPVVHRIERDYRRGCRQCVQCRRWKVPEQFDRTLCIVCADYKKRTAVDRRELSCIKVEPPSRSSLQPAYRKPEEPIVSIPSPAH